MPICLILVISIANSFFYQQINRLNVSLFTPALLFSKVAFFLTPGMFFSFILTFKDFYQLVIEKLQELWIIPIWFIIVTVASMLVGSLLGSLFRLRQSQRSLILISLYILSNIAQQEFRYRSLHVHELQRSSNRPHAKSRCLGSGPEVGRR